MFGHISAEKWEKVFGGYDREKFRRLARKKRAESSPGLKNGVEIMSEKHHIGYDPALGEVVRSRAHKKELLRAKGLVECGELAKKFWGRDFGPRRQDGSPA